MINLLQSSLCGNDSVNSNNRNQTNLNRKNVQTNNNSDITTNFGENIKMENDRISVIILKDPPLSEPNQVAATGESRRRSSLQKFFQQNYSQFLKNYCLCLNRKIDPDDPIGAIDPTNKNFEGNNYLNQSTIIPITAALKMYSNQIRSPTHRQMDGLNRRNIQSNEHFMDKIVTEANSNLEHTAVNSKSPVVNVQNNHVEINHMAKEDGDKNQLRPHSHASTVTTKSIQDELSNAENQLKTAVSPGASTSIEEVITGKSNATSAENLDNLSAIESEVIDTSLEHIQNESNEKLIAADTNVDGAANQTEVRIEDVVDGADEITNEITIESQPSEQLLDAAFINVGKPSLIYDNESRSDSDSRSLTSTESSDYPAIRGNSAKALVIPVGEQKVINKPIPKLRPAIITRRNKVMPIKSYPSSATTHAVMAPNLKSTEIFANNLRKFEKPRDASNNCLNQLESQNWEVTMNGLQNFVRLIRHHPETVEASLHVYCVALSRHVKNLRSQVSRSACQASAEFFQTHAKHLETECEDLATQLFNRTADTNKFLRADAFRSLASMCDNLPPQKVIQIIVTRGAAHQNAIVRTASANLCSRIVSRLGCEKVYAMQREHRDKLILAGANGRQFRHSE